MAVTGAIERAGRALPASQVALRERCAHPSGAFEPLPPFTVGDSVVRRFEQIVRRYPDRLAVKTSRLSLSYSDLDRAANQIAHAILEHRGERAEPIAMLMEKGTALIAAELGVMKAGKISVPLDPAFPETRLETLLGECQAPLVLTSARYERLASELAAGRLGVLDVEALDGAAGTSDPHLSIDGESLAFLIFTSGSTGQPKGVLQCHRALLAQAGRHINTLKICAEDRVSVMGSMGAMQAHTQIFVSLLSGAAAFPWDLKEDGLAELTSWLAREEITYHRSSASIFRHWAERLGSGEALLSLRLVGVGSEPVYRSDFELYRSRFAPSCLFLNALSSTETGTMAMNLLDRDSTLDGRMVPVGYPVDDIEVLLLDETGAEVGDGDVGEMAVRSANLAVGYWGQDELTRAKFRAEPGGARTYRVGDVGRRGPDGALVHLGRGDLQVKIHGHRVELGEIEGALREHDSVKEAAVVDCDDHHGQRRLVAYLVAKEETRPTRGALRSALREQLPHYMIPHAFQFLDALPRAASGKVDRRALPSFTFASLPRTTAGAPRGMLGALVGAIWEDLLGVTDIGQGDDFLEVGGDSLLAIEMLARVEEVCGRALAPSRLLEGAITIDRLVQMLLDDQRESWGEPIVALQCGGTRPPLFFLHGDFEHGGLYCHSLSRALGPAQPFYSVTPHGLDGGALPWSIEAMAADRLAAIKAVQPTGPYRLGGFCNGGVIAFEMARRLQAMGEVVEALLLIDGRALNGPPLFRALSRATREIAKARGWSEAKRRELFLRLRTFVEVYEESSQPGGRGRARFLLDKVRRNSRAPARRPHAADRADTAADEVSDRAVLRPAYGERLRDFVPGRYRGRIALFRSSHLLTRPPSGPTAGWRHVASAVDVHPLPGNHQQAVTRHVEVLAEKMTPYLAPRPRV